MNHGDLSVEFVLGVWEGVAEGMGGGGNRSPKFIIEKNRKAS